MSRHEHSNERFDPEDIDYLNIGEVPAVDLNLKPPEPPKPFIETIFEKRPRVNSGELLAKIKTGTAFDERGEHWKILHDPIGMIRDVAGIKETYEGKLKKEEKKGKKEAASFGLIHIGEHEAVMFAMHWDFFAGSLGVVAGTKFQEAADLATKKKLPFISIYTSSGVRQQENSPGLFQMPRTVNAIKNFREKTNQPHIAILSGQVWGGISASAVPQGDLKISITGTNYGFSGPDVIKSHTGEDVPVGMQSVEAHTLKERNLDVLVRDERELLRYMNRLFQTLDNRERKLSTEDLKNLKLNTSGERIFSFTGENRFISPLAKIETAPVPVFPEQKKTPAKPTPEKDKLYLQYEEHIRSAKRPDTEFYIDTVFSDVVKLYNASEKKERVNEIEYPAIIAAIGKIGPQPYLIVGNQPSYYETSDGVKKKPSSPEPKDLDYLMRMLNMGAKLGLPVVYFCDTPGAKPTPESERLGQSDKISNAILAGIEYPHPVISVVTGMLGSGGGLATTPIGDFCAMQEKALACVAEPRSATAILLKKANVTPDEIKTTLNSMRATAKDQVELGIMDAVIPEGESPYDAAQNIQSIIAKKTIELQAYSKRKLLGERNKRIRRQEGIPIKK